MIEAGSDSLLNAQWARVRGRLRAEFGEATFRSWLKPLTLAGRRGQDLRVAVPSRFMRDWVATHYADRIMALWTSECPEIRSVEVIVDARDAAASDDSALDDAMMETPVAGDHAAPADALPQIAGAAINEADGLAEVSATLDPRLTFDNFVVGKSNELAHAAALRVAESDVVPFNPLFLYGGVGLGKTHLMHAIAHHIKKKQPQKRVIYLSAEKFMYQFIRALRNKNTMAFKELFRSVDVLMVDDVQFIIGKESTQEEFFHTFNALFDQNKQVVLSADKSPSDLQGLEERMRTRFGWGLVADIHPTTYELRLGILQAKAEAAPIDIPGKVLEFLAHRISSNVRELEGALTRIIAHATLVGRPVSVESAQELLKDLLRANDRSVTIEEIQRRVAEHYNIKLADMSSPRRARQVSRPRQIAMYLAKQLTTKSLPDIGRSFGGRDHTTVMHAVKKVEELASGDISFAEDIDLLKRMLEG
ncbi:chromosomal replication initiator protein DnaA [Dongia rigui]|uniref:Chromosomal replication initiator protein DnaA n=1 Tax=Dongia rigui TaxID=940149 RepID=A0ABU5E425_9PROT|nr:chromosomal replication initiator protein DnaA [Dongia rigui]MDY0873965.1 chromosomal replication initiator protein DnaA [Dongia rigui]